MSHGSLDKTVVQMKRKAPPDSEAASAKQLKDEARDLRLYNCAQCQCTCWGLQQLANHVLRAHGPTSLLGGQFPGSEGKVMGTAITANGATFQGSTVLVPHLYFTK